MAARRALTRVIGGEALLRLCSGGSRSRLAPNVPVSAWRSHREHEHGRGCWPDAGTARRIQKARTPTRIPRPFHWGSDSDAGTGAANSTTTHSFAAAGGGGGGGGTRAAWGSLKKQQTQVSGQGALENHAVRASQVQMVQMGGHQRQGSHPRPPLATGLMQVMAATELFGGLPPLSRRKTAGGVVYHILAVSL